MTSNSWLILIILGGVGAAMEPKITPYLLELSKVNIASSDAVLKPDLEEPDLDFELKEAKPEDFPKYFMLKEDWVVSTKNGELVAVKSGSEWKYDHHHEEMVYFKGLGGMTGQIHIGHTDMVDALRETILERKLKAQALENAKAAKAEQPGNETASSQKQKQEKELQKLDPPEDKPAEKPVVTEKTRVDPPAPSPIKEIKVEPKKGITSSKPLSAEEIVSLMKSSVGELKEFSADQVVSWSPGKDKKDESGEMVQIGHVVYSAETLFGKKDIRAQAIIKNGVVEKWIWPTSGFEIH